MDPSTETATQSHRSDCVCKAVGNSKTPGKRYYVGATSRRLLYGAMFRYPRATRRRPYNDMRRIFQSIIRLYQKTISPDHGWFSKYQKYPTCKYYPTCSQYAHDAIGKYGVIRGGIKSIWRILRCNPWSKGGVDEA